MAYFENRMYCSLVDGRVRVTIDEGDMLCVSYEKKVTEAIYRTQEEKAKAQKRYYRARNEEDRNYRESLILLYAKKNNQLYQHRKMVQ